MPISQVVGCDDAPFARSHRGGVLVVGAVHSGTRLEGIVTGRVRRDGTDASLVIAALVRGSKSRASPPSATRCWPGCAAAPASGGEPLAGVYVQRAGISAAEAAGVIRRTAVHGRIPEPLRTAHLVAGGVGAGQSRGRT